MKRRYFMILITITLFSVLEVIASDTNFPRIVDLLPHYVELPMVNPAIPEDFVAMRANENDGWDYWGPKEVLLTLFKDRKTIKRPIIRVRPSATCQTGPNEFEGGEEFKSLYPDLQEKKLKWGNHPVLAMRWKNEEGIVLLAIVGLNVPGGQSLLFQLLYPTENGSPSIEALEFWENFLKNTTPLSEQDMIKAHGFDMQDGYTIVSVNGTKLKFTAEKRRKDEKLRITVLPLEGKVTFKKDEVITAFMGLQWKYGEPIAKAYGTITAENAKLHGTEVLLEHATTIFIRDVDEFSPIDERFIIHEEFLVES